MAQLDPAGFLRWLLGPAADRYRFRGWLDTSVLPSPGIPERSTELVAELVERSVVAFAWALLVEFQAEPDPELFGPLLEYLGRMWCELRPSDQPERRFQVAAAVVNLTGNGRTSRVMNFGDGIRLSLEVREVNLASLEAAPLLEGIAAGKQALALLPWVPLLRGGNEPASIEQWKSAAALEPDAARRSDYASLTVVLADLVEAGTVWAQALEEWSVKESRFVAQWQAAGEQRGQQMGKAAYLIELLEGRFKKIPSTVSSRIKATEDMAQLDEWFKAAITVPTLAEFRKLLKEKEG